MTTGRRSIPVWAKRERTADMLWIAENMHVLWPAAQEQQKEKGRGAIVVDTTTQPAAGGGNPFAYLNGEELEKLGDEDARRMIAEYDPVKEIVIVLMKARGRSSAYRLYLRPYEGGKGNVAA
jgi:hypothetical protein